MPYEKIIVTASDENFADFLFDLIDSIDQFSSSLVYKIGVLDLGLSEKSKRKLVVRGVEIAHPRWDIDVSEETKEARPYLRALTARPFLPRYFPGYETYLWLDADTWVQGEWAIKFLFDTAKSQTIALAPEIHPSYSFSRGVLQWKTERLSAYYQSDFRNLLHTNRYFNAGVFALNANAPHWQLWAESFSEGVRNCNSKYICDQTALNHAIWKNRLNFYPLPALFNWLCHHSIPTFNKSTWKLCEPHFPHNNIGIIHMTAWTKDTQIKITLGEKQEESSLRFSSMKKLNQR